MDFGSLLHAAQENEYKAKNETKKCYTTSFAAPKKEQKNNKSLSVNIQKFLQRKEEEEKRKEQDAKKKRDELLALRSQDGKAKKRVSAMLKRTKAANKSVIEDAIDEDNTAVTISGPSQPDEDDYGYVSQEASAYYDKLMDKYSAAPVEEPLYSAKKKSVHRDLNSTKDRVRMALQREEEEEMMPHKRKRKKKREDDPGDTTVDYRSSDLRDLGPRVSDNEEEEVEREPEKPKVKRPPAPPPINFHELLKLAEKKQFEPVKIEPKKKPEDEEHRPMTKKQKLEYLKEQEWRRRKEAMKSGQAPPPSSASQTVKIPKISLKDEQTSSTSDRGQERPAVPVQQMRIPKKPNVNREEKSTFLRQEERSAGGYRKEERPPNGMRKSVSVGAPPAKIPRPNGSVSRENADSAPLRTNSTNKDDRALKKIPKESDDVMRRQRTDGGSSSVRKPQVYEDGERSKGNRIDHTNASSNDSRRLPSKTSERKPNPEFILKHLQESGYDKKLQEAIMEKMMEYERNKRMEESGKPPGKELVPKVPRETEKSGMATKTQRMMPGKSDRPLANHKPSSAGNNRQQELTPQNRPSAVPLSKPKVLPPEGKSKPVPSSSKSLSAGDVRTKPTPQPSAQGKAAAASDSRKMPPPKQIPPGARPKNIPPPDARPKQFPPTDMKPKQFPPADMKPKQFPPADMRPKQFPPADMRPKQFPPPDMRKKSKPPMKRRITDSEDEYDSEMDDFIDDGPEEEEDYSKHIREIFGYDRRKYSRIDDDDDECMESNFATILKEDFISTKTAIMEDLEELRKEKELERREKLAKMKKKK